MTAMALDTYEAVRALRDAGMREDQAKAIVSLVKQGSGFAQDLATKQDLKEGLRNLERRMLDPMTGQLAILERRMTIRLGLMMFAVAGLSIGIAKLLF